jgi:hypothetical protein
LSAGSTEKCRQIDVWGVFSASAVETQPPLRTSWSNAGFNEGGSGEYFAASKVLITAVLLATMQA